MLDSLEIFYDIHNLLPGHNRFVRFFEVLHLRHYSTVSCIDKKKRQPCTALPDEPDTSEPCREIMDF